MASTSLGAGDITITLDGEEVTLKPTLRAAQTISRQAGGIMAAVQAVGRFDMEVITSVVALGLNATKPRDVSEIAEKVYATGLTELVQPVTTFLTTLANGGRPVDQSVGGEEEKDPR